MSSWYKELTQRLVWASRAIVTDSNNPVIRLDNGLSLDLANNRIILEGDFALHTTGQIDLSADGNVIINGHKFVDPKQQHLQSEPRTDS